MREEWYADSYHLTDGFVRDIETRSGHKQRMPLRGDSVYSAQQHGELWRKHYLDSGEVVVNFWIYDKTQALVEQWWEEMLRALTPVARLVHVERTLPSGSVRECYGYCQESVQPEWDGPLLMRVGFALHIPSGRWQDLTDTTMATVAGAALPQVLPLTLFAGATAVMDGLVYRVDGPIAAPTVESLSDVDGTVFESFTYAGAIPAGKWLTVDAGAWTLAGGGGFVPDPAIITYTSNRFLSVYPARPAVVPTVRLSGANGGAGTRLSVTGRIQYAS